MTLFKWILVASFLISSGIVLGMIGQERKPYTNADAFVIFVLNALIIYGLINNW